MFLFPRYMKLIIAVFAVTGAVSSATATEHGRLALFSGRLSAGEQRNFDIPDGFDLVITDIVIQNRAFGDKPAAINQYSEVQIMTNPEGFTILVIGKQTFHPGLSARVLVHGGNFVKGIQNNFKSEPLFIEYTVTGRFVPAAN